MQVWVAVVARRGDPPGDWSDWIREHASAWLPFADAVARTGSWTSVSGRVQIHTWDNGQEVVDEQIASSTPDAATTLAGHAHEGGRLLAHDAIERLLSSSGDAAEAVYRLGGSFAACRCEGDVIRAWSSRGRLMPVFYAVADDRCVASNRPLAAHLVAQQSIEIAYDEQYAVGLLASGLPSGERAPFAGVAQLPEMAELRLSATGVEIRSTGDERSLPPDPGSAHSLADALVESIAFLRDIDIPIQVSLSGGKDSRLVVALLARAGVDFRAATTGFPDHPDVIVAAQVAAELGVEHFVVPPSASESVTEVDLGQRVLRVLRNSDGLLSPFDSPSSANGGRALPGIGLGGAGGEVLRGGLARDPHVDRWTVHLKLIWQMLQNERFLTPAAIEVQQGVCNDWIAANADLSPADALAWYHRDIRLGRWNMAGRLTQYGRLTVQPFLDAQAIRRAMAVPLRDRCSERAFFALLAHVNPRLAELPLANSSWRFEGAASGQAGPAPYNWRTHLSGALGTSLGEMVLDSPARDRLFEIVDRDRFEQFLASVRAGKVDGREPPARFLWAAAGTAMLWSADWRTIPTTPVGPRIDISPPLRPDSPASARPTSAELRKLPPTRRSACRLRIPGRFAAVAARVELAARSLAAVVTRRRRPRRWPLREPGQ